MQEEKENRNSFESVRYCKKCLLRDIKEDTYFKNLQEYIAGLEEEIKVSNEEYEERLKLCKQCENLLNGMCRICGCFVELRAAMIKNYCPALERYW